MAEERDDLITKLIEAKCGYGCREENNFVLASELTVTITLDEYRKLIMLKGSHEAEVDEVKKEKRVLENELNKLKEENHKLKEKLLDSINTEDTEEES